MVLISLYCADMPLRNYSLHHCVCSAGILHVVQTAETKRARSSVCLSILGPSAMHDAVVSQFRTKANADNSYSPDGHSGVCTTLFSAFVKVSD